MTAPSLGLAQPREVGTAATGCSTAFGTFGELLQGVLPEQNRDFLVTLPIARWSTARFTVDPAMTTVVVRPAHKSKARRAATALLEFAGITAGGVLVLDSGLPEGKGMASSSADLVATVRAVGNAIGVRATPELIESVLRQIEPTDGVMYQGIVSFYHREVRMRQFLGSLPPLTVVGADEGGAIDTVAFNRIPKPFSPAEKREYARLLDTLTDAVRDADVRAVGRVATRSAELNQSLRPKRLLTDITSVCQQAGGLGVVAAHSGTTLGVLLDNRDPEYPDRLAFVANALGTLAGNATVHRTLCFDQW
jgi:L-threonine kinase